MNSVGSIKSIIKRDGRVVPFDRDRITTAVFKAAASLGGSDAREAERLAAIVEKKLSDSYKAQIPTVEDVQDVVEAVLMEYGHLKTAKAYIIYRYQRAKLREARKNIIEAADNIPYRKIYDVLCWNIDHACESVAQINRIIREGNFPDFVRICEERYLNECQTAAEEVLRRRDELRLIIVAGPSSSGKTTTTIKMKEILARQGLRLKAINIDHYFFDLEMHPKDEFGDYDYETPQALDIELINQHLEQLLDGKAIRTPHYDFRTGKRTLEAHEMHLENNELLIIDSLHGLYSKMTSSVLPAHKFRLYIETLGQLRNETGEFMRWADHRLLRRMIRDSWNRNHNPMSTLTHWHYVRKSELQHIIPFIKNADFVVNSALPYEFPVLKHKLFHLFPKAVKRFRTNPKRQDAYYRAKRIIQFLEPMMEYKELDCIPSDSLFREFIGGSVYDYA